MAATQELSAEAISHFIENELAEISFTEIGT